MAKTYEQGEIDAIALYGKVCNKFITRSCDGCPLEYITRGTNKSCVQVAKENPPEFLSQLKSADSSHTYADQFRLMHPSSGLNSEELADLQMCRKIIFDGDMSCAAKDGFDKERCLLCWEQIYGKVEEPKKTEKKDPFS